MSQPASVRNLFDLTDRIAIITGGAGLLGVRHAEAIAEMGGTPVLVDIDEEQVRARALEIARNYGCKAIGIPADISRPEAVSDLLTCVLLAFDRVDILINNAANNPKMEAAPESSIHWSRLEHFSLASWNQDMAVGLTGAFLCSQIIGSELARRRNGVILNIASDLGVIAPDQRIYHGPNLPEER